MAHRAGDDAEREPVDPERRGEQQGRPDDREVVDDRRDGRGREPATRVEDARRDRPERQEDRAEQHDPGQLDGLVELGRPEARRDRRDQDRREDEDADREHGQPDEHQVDDGRHDSPGARPFVGREQARDDRDEGRGQRPRRDELEDEVGQPERREERIELGRRPERVADDDEADVTEHPRHEECARDDQSRAGQRAPGGHRLGSRRALGCASRYAAWSRPGETWV